VRHSWRPDLPRQSRSPRTPATYSSTGTARRIAALEAGCASVPAVVDESIMAGDGDLDAMATENLGRQDLPELAQANLFARYSESG
jgi:ParB family transcriptional regulator, chromosome partitioning protein